MAAARFSFKQGEGRSRANSSHRLLLGTSLLALGLFPMGALAQQSSSALPDINVVASPAFSGAPSFGSASGASGAGEAQPAYASKQETHTESANLGPLGDRTIQDTPYSITVVPRDVIVNDGDHKVNDVLMSLPSVEIRDQQGFDVSRPQSRGFQGSVVQTTRLDGLNVIGTTAIPAENLNSIQVLNGLAGALYGPATPAGVFNYVLNRPTATPMFRTIEGFDSNGILTEQIDAGGMAGPDNRIGYRITLLHGDGESYVSGSEVNRNLASIGLDFHIDNQTVIETNYIHYTGIEEGLPGSIVFDSGKSTILPKPPSATTIGLGQPGAGVNLDSDTGIIKLKHQFNNDWNFEIGVLDEDAHRGLYGITNTMTNNAGAYTVTKNFTAVPLYTILSNEAYLNGKFDLLGTANELTIGTNGYSQGSQSYRNSIAQTLGTSNLSDPALFALPPIPANGGLYRSAYLFNQTIITGDTMHFNDKLALQGVISTSFLNSKSWAATGAATSSNTSDGLVSPTLSLIYKPISQLTTYFTWANSVEQGDTAPSGTKNVNAIMDPYHDTSYELGAKYAVNDRLLITLDGFRMTRPMAQTVAATNVFEVVGTQRNWGAELFAQGDVTPEFSVLGGVTGIDAHLVNTGIAATNNGYVVGVPRWKSDIKLDYHPDWFHGVGFTGTFHYEAARAATDTNNSWSDPFMTVDLGARYSTALFGHHATFRLNVVNITNTNYYVAIADGNIVGSPGANTAYLGTPRTYRASLEFDF